MIDVVGYEGIFQVTEDGRIFSLRTNKFLVQNISKTGYRYISTRVRGVAKSFRVHRAVAIAYLPNPENKTEVNHINGNKNDNNLNNLEWVTPKENIRHAFDTGLIKAKRGCNHVSSTLTEEDVAIIKELYIPYHKEFGTRGLAKKYNVHHMNISRVIRGISYKDTN